MGELSLERVARSPRTYELRDGDFVLGYLRYPRRLSDGAEAESPEGGWRLPGRRAFRSARPLLSTDGGSEIGYVRRRWWRGGVDLELLGRVFTLRKSSWWRGSWVIAEGDVALLSVGARSMSTREPLRLEIHTDVPIPVMLLSAHLILLTIRDESAAAGAAAGAAATG